VVGLNYNVRIQMTNVSFIIVKKVQALLTHMTRLKLLIDTKIYFTVSSVM